MSYQDALAIHALGMTSCLGRTAEGNAAIMRCGYSGAGFSNYMQPYEAQPQLVAEIPDYKGIRGMALWLNMSIDVIKQVKQSLPQLDIASLPIFVCFPSPASYDSYLNDGFKKEFYSRLMHTLAITRPHPKSAYTFSGRVSLVVGIKEIRKRIYTENIHHALLICIDSLLNAEALRYYGGDLYGNQRRLMGETNPNGFIPGEAAVALLLGKPEAGKAQTCITGMGFGHEPATIGSGDILRANGLSEAIRQAAADAGIRVCDTDFRISSANGEEYWFKEASLAQSRTLEHKRDTHPLWHPADNIGEVGAAVGGAMVVMAHYAFAKGYAPGRRALCQISNDDHQRGAFILERTGGKG